MERPAKARRAMMMRAAALLPGLLAWVLTALTGLGLCAVTAGALAVRGFARRPKPAARHRPPVSVFKPLYGDEPRLEQALASICRQTYPDFHVIFGVRDAADPALKAVRRLQARFPGRDITVVIDPSLHGINRKVSNLINMFPMARHDVLVFSDSDLHVAPDYLDQIVAALEESDVGLVTTVCLGLPTGPGLAARLGATQISHCFVPGAILARMMGRQDCLGTTMALRRDTLARVGGLHALATHLADDNVLGQRVRRLGLQVALAPTVPLTAVPSASLRCLWQHELRWARTIGALEPMLYATSALQYPLFWALLGVVFTAGSAWSVTLFLLAWTVRVGAAQCTTRALRQEGRPPVPVPLWLLPLRDIFCVGEIAASYLGSRVVWRGHAMLADDGRSAPPAPSPL